MRNILSGEVMLDKIAKGINKLADVVASTLGPQGKNVLINNRGIPEVTNDGITVAKAFETEDPIENFGANMIKSVSAKTVEQCGDGTTTACILSRSMLNSSMEYLKSGSNPIDLKKGMQIALDDVNKQLNIIKKEVKTNDEVFNVAKISGNNDDFIGQTVAKAYQDVGLDGIVTMERGHSTETYIDMQNGYKFDKGYIDPIYINNEAKQSVYHDSGCNILICTDGLKNINDLFAVLTQDKKPLLIISDNVVKEVREMYKANNDKLKGSIKFCVVGTPSYDSNKVDMLRDMIIVTGATEISNGMYLGKCEAFSVTRDNTTIINPKGDQEEINDRLGLMRSMKDNKKNKFHNILLDERIGKIKGKLAIIMIGAKSILERDELYARFDDATNATKAAIEEGTVTGGGYTLYSISKKIKCKEKNKDVIKGYEVVKRSLKESIIQIAKNCNQDEDKIIEKMNRTKLGYNAKNNRFEDLDKAGILDSKKVVRCALENSVSVVSTLILSNTIIF